MEKTAINRTVILKAYRNEIVKALDGMIEAFTDREDVLATAYWDEAESHMDILSKVVDDAVGNPFLYLIANNRI